MEFITTARQAEENAAAVMRRLGYPDACVTGAGPDSGIDVVSSTALAQVKWQGAVVGRPELQRLVGARGRATDKGLMFFAASGFSQAAVDYADDLEVALFLYDPTGTPTAQNLLAHKTIKRQMLTGSDSGDSSSDEVAVPPVEPTVEESAAEIVAIVSELSVEKFNSLHVEMRVGIEVSYQSAIVVADQLFDRFDDPELAERYDQQWEEDFDRQRKAYKDWRADEVKRLDESGVSKRFREFGTPPKGVATVTASDVLRRRDRSFGNPFHPERSMRLKNRYSVETPLSPLYKTHYLLMPFKSDADGRCFAYDPERGTYEAFDNESREFLNPYDRGQEQLDRLLAAHAEEMRQRAAVLRNL